MKRILSPLVGLAVLWPCGCSSMNNTEKGGLTGGALGAGAGALIGGATGHAGAGALIGGGVGALTGALVGNGVDKAEKKAEEAKAIAAANPPPPPLSLPDVVSLSQQHVSDAVIINQIRATGSVYLLSPTDISWLKTNGVSDPVIMEMQATATRYPRRVYSAVPGYPPPAVYVVEPPPPPVSVGVGIGYTHYGRGWR